MGNMVAGQEMISKAEMGDTQVWGLTTPLITNEEGNKLGKTAGAPVWLCPDLTSPFSLYQFLLRLPDSQQAAMLGYFTFLSAGEREALMESQADNPERRPAQRAVAEAVCLSCLLCSDHDSAVQVTLLAHGRAGLELAQRTTGILYGGDLAALAQLSPKQAGQVFTGAPYLQRLYSVGLTALDLANMIGCFRSEKALAGNPHLSIQQLVNGLFPHAELPAAVVVCMISKMVG